MNADQKTEEHQPLTYFPSIIPSDDVKGEWAEEMSSMRTHVTFATPMLAYMMYRCEIHWTHDEVIQTAAAMPWNGKNHLFFNPAFIMGVLESTNQRAFVLLHEVLHIFLEHVGRASMHGYDRKLWNIATDYAINLICAGAYSDENGGVAYAKKYTKYLQMPENLLYDVKYIDMSADQIYHLLLEESDMDAQKAVEAATGDDQGELDAVADVDPSEEQTATNRRSASAGVSAAEQQNNAIGENEGNLVKAIRNMSRPVVSWEDELQEAVQHCTKERSTYNRLSRKHGEGGIVFPSLTGQRISGVFGFDSSGSMSEDDYAAVLGELAGILDTFESWDIHIVSCDTQAHVLGEYSSDDDDDISTISLEARGCGGTELSPIANYAVDQMDMGENINFCIIVTDGGFFPEHLDPHLSDEMTNIVVVTRGGNNDLVLEDAKVVLMDNIISS